MRKAVTVVREVIGQLDTRRETRVRRDRRRHHRLSVHARICRSAGCPGRPGSMSPTSLTGGRLRPYVDIVATSDDGESNWR